MFGEKYTEDRNVIETQEYLRVIFDYRDDGRLIIKQRPDEYYKSETAKKVASHRWGQPIGSIKPVYQKHEMHYWICSIHTVSCRCSRLVWIWNNGAIPDGLEIDHINGDPLDDRIENLRVATRRQQLLNRKVLCTNSTGYVGVHKMADGKFQAVLTRKFDTAEEANEWRVSRANEELEWLRETENV